MGWLAPVLPKLLLLGACIQIALLLVASWSDLASRLIPDGACVALGVAGAVTRLLTNPTEFALSLVAATAILILLMVAYSRRLLGGGDIKLMVAVVLGQTLAGTIQFFAITAVAGGILALVHVGARHLPRPARAAAGASTLRRVYAAERWRMLRRAPLPYGLAIACGGIWAVLAHTGS